MHRILSRRSLAVLGGGAAVATGSVLWLQQRENRVALAESARSNEPSARLNVPSREQQLASLKSGALFDVLVIGGGATGSGCALDAATRGLKVGLVEYDDFASGTSGRSTKLIHGGVRYLERAVKEFDREEYALVREALHERHNLLMIAPHLSNILPIMVPVYKWWQVPYFWAGTKLYDMVAGSQNTHHSYFLGRARALRAFPMLQSKNLVGALVYFDGQHNDARMNLAIALTAADRGATVANHVEVLSLIHETQAGSSQKLLKGARLRDRLSGEEWDVYAKSIINATGPHADVIRKMDDADCQPIVQHSAGVHVVLPDYYSPENMGLLDAKTSDGRVIFFLPWEGKTIVGTTDSPCPLSTSPRPREEDIQFILHEIAKYLTPDIQVRRTDVLSAWSGIRPLVSDPNSPNTAALSRTHVVLASPTGLVTVAGGKWTTYRIMAQDTLDKACLVSGLQCGPSKTDGLMLMGGEGYTDNLFISLVQNYGLQSQVAKHLARTYGDKAWEVAELAAVRGEHPDDERGNSIVGKRLVPDLLYIEAEVRYAIREYAATATDVLARRTRLAFLHTRAAETALPRIIEIMGDELGWDKERRRREAAEARALLDTMGHKWDVPGSADLTSVVSASKKTAIPVNRTGGGV